VGIGSRRVGQINYISGKIRTTSWSSNNCHGYYTFKVSHDHSHSLYTGLPLLPSGILQGVRHVVLADMVRRGPEMRIIVRRTEYKGC
jgi:hypothetical protein